MSEEWLVGGPMFFIAVGVAVGPLGLDLIRLNADADALRVMVGLGHEGLRRYFICC